MSTDPAARSTDATRPKKINTYPIGGFRLRLAVRPYLTLRVVPAAAGVHAGIAGAFQLMEFTDFRPVAYLDSETASIFLEEDGEIAAYRRTLSALAAAALDEGQSKELIANIAIELYADSEEHDERP